MNPDHVFESVPNFSEGTRQEVIAELAAAAAEAHILDVDADADHNRVVISIAGHRANLLDALFASVQAAVERIDLRVHRGVHPRVGAADVIPIVPLGGDLPGPAQEVARELGERIWSELRVPVYYYGHGEQHTLADIRAGRVKPGLGGPHLHPSAGAVCVGARHPLLAFNVMLPSVDLAGGRAVARALRESAGGMRGVQALAFELHGGRIQLSMNLFRLDETAPADVMAELGRRGVTIGSQHVIGLCPAAVANPAAAGRLLEARLAAAAARRGADLSAALGDDEHTRLAVRLRREAGQLGRAGVDQDILLAGAERAAALVPVLRAAGVLDRELESMLRLAARGLRSALEPATVSRHTVRIGVLDQTLAAAKSE